MGIVALAILRARTGHDRLFHDAGVDAEAIPELECDQTLGVVILRRRDGTCRGAWIGVDQAQTSCGEWCGVPNPDCRYCAITPVTRIKSLRTPNKSGLLPEVNGWFGVTQSCT